MTAGERLRGWIDATAKTFSGRLGGWMASWVEQGIEKTMDFMEPDMRAELAPTIDRLLALEGLPEDFKSILGKAREEPKAIHWIFLIPMLIGMLLAAGMGIVQPVMNVGKYGIDRLMKSARIDPLSVITAWRRDPATYQQWFDDLKDQGWSAERIEALKFITLVYPSRQDGIRYVAKEALEPEAIDKYGLMDEFDKIDLSLFEQIGVPEETVKLDWIAHWEHASWMQMVEMLHRGLVTEEEVYEWFRVVEMVPYWRNLLIQTAYTWPTRVDVRRWWDMRTIDETELRRLYSGMGYRGVNLDNYVLWTKVYVAFPDLMARWSKGWITEDVVRTELTQLGMPADRVTEMIQTKVKPTEQEPISDAKKVTQTSIIKWVKEDIEARWEQGIDLLMDLGYDEKGARFTLGAYIAELGSPETYDDWKKITTEYKIATGREAKPMPEEIKTAADEVVKLTAEVEALERSIVEEKRGLIDQEVIPEETTKRLKSLQVKRNRAESKLSTAKSEYDRLVAEWRHGLP